MTEQNYFQALDTIIETYSAKKSKTESNLKQFSVLAKFARGEDHGQERSFLLEIQKMGNFPLLHFVDQLFQASTGREHFFRTIMLLDHLDTSGFPKSFLFLTDKVDESLEEMVKVDLGLLEKFGQLRGCTELMEKISQVLTAKDQESFCLKLLDLTIFFYGDQKIAALRKMLWGGPMSSSAGFIEENQGAQKLISKMGRVRRDFPKASMNSFSDGQMRSKKWLIDELNKLEGFASERSKILILGGWQGLLARLLFDFLNVRVKKIRSVDIDPECEKVADTYNKEEVIDSWRFKASTADMYELSYSATTLVLTNSRGEQSLEADFYDVLINTSCEHLENFAAWYSKIPVGKKIVLQSNNYFSEPGHLNCSKSLEEFKSMAPMKIHYEGTLELEKYSRFMLIGEKR